MACWLLQVHCWAGCWRVAGVGLRIGWLAGCVAATKCGAACHLHQALLTCLADRMSPSLTAGPPCCRLQKNGEDEVRGVQNQLSDLDAQSAALELDIREKSDQIEGLQTEKELQSGGEVKELQETVDEISKRWVGGWPAVGPIPGTCIWVGSWVSAASYEGQVGEVL